MRLSSSIPYLKHRLSSSSSYDLGFIDMGLGIEQRASDYGEYWKSHLEKCKKLQDKWLTENKINNCAVLGAGRLLDVSERTLASEELHLYDADEIAAKHWPKNSCAHIGDITGVLKSWKNQISQQKFSKFEEALVFLQNIAEQDLPPSTFLKGDHEAILSLNILSQLPIMWQDIVESTLSKQFNLSDTREQLIDSLQLSAQGLVLGHLRDISKAKTALLITDITILHYKLLEGRAPLAPITAQSSEEFISNNSSIELEQIAGDALFGTDVDFKKYFADSFSNIQESSWLWHIVPATKTRSGTIHFVKALSLNSAT